jgi:hypothetical protein
MTRKARLRAAAETAAIGDVTVPPQELFKYVKSRYVDGMLRHGVFRIGTLDDYRNQGRLGPEKGDVGEGTQRVSRFVESAEIEDLQRDPVASKVIGGPETGARYVTFEGVEFGARERVEDVFVFCTTNYPSRRSMLKVGDDACIRITNPRGFFRTLTEELLRLELIDELLAVAACTYGRRDTRYEKRVQQHPAFIKLPELSYQHEVRAIWSPRTRPIEPRNIQVPAATKYLQWHPL